MQIKKNKKLKVERKANKTVGDTSRVITCFHFPDKKYRISKIIKRIISLPETDAQNLMKRIMTDFSGRHENIGHIFERHFNEIKTYVPVDTILTDLQSALI